jgi:hypothetical protein
MQSSLIIKTVQDIIMELLGDSAEGGIPGNSSTGERNIELVLLPA